MTGFTGAQIIIPNAVAPSGAPKVSNDAIDVAIGTIASNVFAYARAKRWTTPNTPPIVDRTGNPVTIQHTGQVYNSSDASFGGLPSINVAGCADTPYVIPSRGAAPPSSFTFLAAIDITAVSSHDHCLVSQSISGGLGMTCFANATPNNDGSAYVGGYESTAGYPAALNTPCIFVCSFDNSTKIFRAGLNGLPTNAATMSGNLSPGASDFFRIFGYVTDNGYNMLGKWETFAIFNQAAGAGYAIDPLLAAAITSMRGVYEF